MAIQTKENPLKPVQGSTSVEKTKHAGKPLDPMLSKYDEEGILGAKPGAVKMGNRSEVSVDEAEKALSDERRSAMQQRLAPIREEMAKDLESGKESDRAARFASVAGTVLTLGLTGYSTLFKPAALSPGEGMATIVTCAACLSIYAAMYYYYSMRKNKREAKHVSMNSILLSIGDGAAIHHTGNDIANAKTNNNFRKGIVELADEGNAMAAKIREALDKP